MSTDSPVPSLLLDSLTESTRSILRTKPQVETIENPSIDDFGGPESRRWVKIPDVVAVSYDLRNSSQLGTGRHDSTTARIYEAAVEGAVSVLHEFGANFIDIQGDGGFGLFWGDLSYERAFCAAVTVRTFSSALLDCLKSELSSADSLPETGFKVGMAADRLLVKTIGTPRDVSEQEAVWPGRAVNHAVKCAQSAQANQIVVTDRVWDGLQNNDFVMYTCGCGGGAPGQIVDLWKPFHIEKITDGRYNEGFLLESTWCAKHGDEFCAKIMAGESKRDLNRERTEFDKARMAAAVDRRRGNRPLWRKIFG